MESLEVLAMHLSNSVMDCTIWRSSPLLRMDFVHKRQSRTDEVNAQSLSEKISFFAISKSPSTRISLIFYHVVYYTLRKSGAAERTVTGIYRPREKIWWKYACIFFSFHPMQSLWSRSSLDVPLSPIRYSGVLLRRWNSNDGIERPSLPAENTSWARPVVAH